MGISRISELPPRYIAWWSLTILYAQTSCWHSMDTLLKLLPLNFERPILALTSIHIFMAWMACRLPLTWSNVFESVGHVDVGSCQKRPCPAEQQPCLNSLSLIVKLVPTPSRWTNPFITSVTNTKRCPDALSVRGLAWRHATLLLLGKLSLNHPRKTTKLQELTKEVGDLWAESWLYKNYQKLTHSMLMHS